MQLFFLFILAPFLLFSGEFTARVNQNQVKVGESFTLTLTLQDATTRESPHVDSLKKLFIVYSQQQSSNTVMINGQISSNRTWYVTLIPQEVGEFKIPAMSIDTSEGILLTEPITIHVEKGSSSTLESSLVNGVTLSAEISKRNPYKNEPIVYTIRLTAKRNLANLQLQKIDIEEAIIEAEGEPKVYEKIVNGMRVNVIDFTYLITPLKAGVLRIPPALLQGEIPTKREGHPRSLLDMMQGFDQLEPFRLSTEETFLDVQPAMPAMSSWLPAESLKMEEIWDDTQVIQEGEPITRSFKITAEGIRSNQIPSLQDLQIGNTHFKIYADKPEFGDEIKEGKVKSYRKEQYTLIPTQSGSLVLPEISLVWWDVLKKEKVVSMIPARTLHSSPLPNAIALKDQEVSVEEGTQVVVVQRDPILYIIIAGLILLLMGAVFLGIHLQKKIASLTKVPPQKKKRFFSLRLRKKTLKKDKNEKLPDLNPT